MQLRNNNPFGTIDDEGAIVGHQGHVTQIHLLLHHILDFLATARFIEDNQFQIHAHGTGIDMPTLLTFQHVKAGFFQPVTDEIKHHASVIAFNREY